MIEHDGILSCDCSMVQIMEIACKKLSNTDRLSQVMVSKNVFSFIFSFVYIYIVHCEYDTLSDILKHVVI